MASFSVLLLFAGSSAWGAGPAASITTLTVTSGGGAVTTVATPATVTLTAATTAGGSPVTQGVVNFCYSTQLSCSGAALVGTAQLTAAGTASISLRPAVGAHSYKAIFLGTTTVLTSSSASSTLTVTRGATPLFATATTIAATGSAKNYTLTGTVIGDGLAVPSGDVNFVDQTNGNAIVGSAALGRATSAPGFLTVPATTDFTNATPLAVGDFNGDGIPDLIVSFADGSEVLQLGNGDGSFKTKATIPSGQVVTGDFNSDGKLDIAVSGNGVVNVLLGDGTGAFTAVTSGTPIAVSPGGMAVGDYNHDGILDLALSDSSNAYVYLGVGDGTFTAGYTSSILNNNPYGFIVGGRNGMATGDFNGDGNLDFAVAWEVVGYYSYDYSQFNITYLLGDGTGNFTSVTNTLPASLFGGLFNQDPLYESLTDGFVIVAAPVNGDASTNIYASFSYIGCCPGAEVTGSLSSVFNPDGSIGSGLEFESLTVGAPLAAAVVDVTGNGTTQITTRWGTDQQGPLSGIQGDPAEIFYGTGTLPLPDSAGSGFAVGDFNGDGITDIALGGPVATSLVGYQTTVTGAASQVAVSPVGSGAHQVAGSYPGDAAHGSSISAPVSLDSGAGPPTVTLAAPASSIFGNPLPLTATVKSSGVAPTGTVTFLNGSTTLGSSTLSGGVAALSLSNLAPGTYSITASYSGDANNLAATSAAVIVVVSKENSTTTIAASAPSIVFGSAVVLTATVTSSSLTPTGTVTFLNGTSVLGTSTLSGGVGVLSLSSLAVGSYSITASYGGDPNNLAATSAAVTVVVTRAASTTTLGLSATSIPLGAAETLTAMLPPQDRNPGGSVTFYLGRVALGSSSVTGATATLMTSALPAGKDSVTATWTGDANFSGSTSNAVVVLVSPSLALTSSASIIYAGATDSIVIHLGTGTNTTVPTGTITLTSGSYTSQSATLSGGSATIQIAANALPAGNDTITASYSGDAVYPAASATIGVMVTTDPPPGFTISGNALTLTAGAATGNTVAVTLTPVTDFSGTVTLTAAVTATPANDNDPPTISFGSSDTAVLTGSSPVTKMLTISTTPTTRSQNHATTPAGWMARGSAVLACVLLGGLSRRNKRSLHRARTRMLALMLFSGLAASSTACGGHSSKTVPGTTAGTYTITVTGTSGAITSTGTVTVTVQ